MRKSSRAFRLLYNLIARLPGAVQGPLWRAIYWRNHSFNRIWTRETGNLRRNSRRWKAWTAWFEAHGIPAEEVFFGEVVRFPAQRVITFRGFHKDEAGGILPHPETGLLEMLYIVTVDCDVARFPLPSLLDRLNRLLPSRVNRECDDSAASLTPVPRWGRCFTAEELRSRPNVWRGAPFRVLNAES